MILKLKEVQNNIHSCSPPFWAWHGHLQTILSYLVASKTIKEDSETHILNLPDGDQLYSKYYAGSVPIVVYLFHGLGGSTDSNYIQRTALVSRKLGYHVFMLNHRGCGIGAGHARHPYHSGRAEDLSAMINYGKQLIPGAKHVGIGFSLSANALLLLAAGIRGESKLDLAISINAPINLASSADLLLRGLNKIYDKRFLLDLKKHLLINHPDDIGNYSDIKTLKDFDNRFTAPMGGFIDREDYYRQCSAKQYLSQIKMPTIIISAYDDPFVSIDDYKDALISDQVLLHLEKHGGHIGYLERRGFKFNRWLDYALLNYLSVLQTE